MSITNNFQQTSVSERVSEKNSKWLKIKSSFFSETISKKYSEIHISEILEYT